MNAHIGLEGMVQNAQRHREAAVAFLTAAQNSRNAAGRDACLRLAIEYHELAREIEARVKSIETSSQS